MAIPLPGLTLALVIRDWWQSRNAHQHDASCDCSDYSPQHDKHAYTGLPGRAALQITLDQMLNPKVVVISGSAVQNEIQQAFGYFGTVTGVVVEDDGVPRVHYADGTTLAFHPIECL